MELIILTPTYSDWQWQDIVTKEIVDKSNITINPIQHRLFHGDVIDEITEEIITPSPFRTMKNIPCVLDYKGSTHGRSNDKLTYRCIPNDKSLPQFLVPYQSKSKGLEKNKINKYVLVQFKEWSAQDKHPLGTLTNTLGDVDNYDAYTEYQLYSKGLVITLKEFISETLFLKNKKVQESLIDEICERYPFIENRTHLNIFSIDPEGCTDIDDAIGIVEHKDHTTVSVYIANVPLILDHFNLWQHLTDKCSTIYLPMHKLPMLPPILSDNICSLLEEELRFALALAIPLGALPPHPRTQEHEYNNFSASRPPTTSEFGLRGCGGVAPTLKPVLIKVSKNYVYEEPELLEDKDYQTLLKITQTMDPKVQDSHDLVEYYMTQMNWRCAQELVKQNCGILRSAHMKSAHMKSAHMKSAHMKSAHMKEKATEAEEINTASPEVNKFITNWKYASGQYTTIEDKSSHEMIGYDVYTHITSPIRRLVDVINMTLLQDKLGLIRYKNDEAIQFCKLWSSKMKVDFINTSTKSIKKVQNNCLLLTLYLKNKESKKKQHYVIGYLFDRVDTDINKKNKHKYIYNVYIPDYKMISTFKSNELIKPYSTAQFTLHLFMDEDNLKQKIRLQRI